MDKFIPYEKLSKKKKRELDAARRGSWGGLSPVTRRPEDPKAYKRKKLRIEEIDPQLRCMCKAHPAQPAPADILSPRAARAPHPSTRPGRPPRSRRASGRRKGGSAARSSSAP